MSTDKSTTKDIMEVLADGRDGFTKGAEKLDETNSPEIATLFRRLAQQILGEEIQAAPAPSKGNPAQIDMFSQPSSFDKLRVQQKTSTSASAVLEEVEIEENKNYQTIHTVKHDYQAVTDKSGREKLIAHLLQQQEISFDTETTGIDTMEAELVGLSFSVKVHE